MRPRSVHEDQCMDPRRIRPVARSVESPAEDDAQRHDSEDGTRDLGARIGEDARKGQVAGGRERRRHGGIEVRPGDVSERVDHDHDREPERGSDDQCGGTA